METQYLAEWPLQIIKEMVGYSINDARTTEYLQEELQLILYLTP